MLSIQNIRDGVRDSTGEDETDLPDATLDLYINKAFWEIQDKLPFRVKEKTVTFPTVYGVSLYDVPSNFDALRTISIATDVTTDPHVVLTLITPQQYEASHADDVSEYAQPEFYLREGNSIRLLPTPDDIYTVYLKYNAVLADLSNTNNYPPLPQVWGEIIEYGATWRRFKALNDYDRMQQNMAIQRSLISTLKPVEAKELADTKLAALQVVRENNY